MWRIYKPADFGATPLGFRYWGPLHRFDHHQAPPNAPCVDPARAVYYAGCDLAGCLVEVFGDTRVVVMDGRRVVVAQLQREITLLDLRNNGAMRAGTVAALCQTAERQESQAWSRYFYDTPVFSAVEGILYLNAHNAAETFALFERAADALECPANQDFHLSDVANLVLKIADAHNMTMG